MPEVLFSALVVMTFIASMYNYWLLGKGIINRYLFLFILGGYIITEADIALERPAYWAYVALNVWAAFNFLRQSPLVSGTREPRSSSESKPPYSPGSSDSHQ